MKSSFSGGKILAGKLREIAERLERADQVAVGFMENAKYPDGTPVAYVAAIQNYGAPSVNIPPRPFFSDMVKDKSPNWPSQLGAVLKHNDFDAEKSLKLMGEGIGSDLQDSIEDTNDPELKQATIDRKGFPKPLIDTGHMINSVSYEVDGDREKLPDRDVQTRKGS